MALETEILQLLFAGVTVGSIYALIALGFVVVHNVTGIVNFAQGDFAMLGALIAVTLTEKTPIFNRVLTAEFNLPLPVGVALSVLISAALGALFYLVAIRPARNASIVSLIIITIGAHFALQGAALITWAADPYSLPRFSSGPPLEVIGAILTRQNIWVIGVTVVLLLLLYLFFERTMLGKALRACAINRTAARLMGIDINRMALLSFALSAAIGAIAGIVITPANSMSYGDGTFLSLKGFVAAVMGGLNSATGAVVGGIVLGILETLGARYLSSGYKDAIAFLVLFAILFVRLSGALRRGQSPLEESGL
ncbi:MAG: branched-chain amino acid ABC transporter permease [Chloroflexi bacterium]|nr:branched-chain amino acid ABC transporter permease [Chloroflexota bacterium]